MKYYSSIAIGAICLSLVFIIAAGDVLALGPAIKNPLGDNVTFTSVLINFTNWLLGLVAILALLGVVFGGIRMIVAVGDEHGLSSAKGIVKWSIAGLVVSILAYTIISIIATEIFGVSQGPLLSIPIAYAAQSIIGLDTIKEGTKLPNLDSYTLAYNIVDYITSIAAIVAATVFIIGAFMVVVSLGDERRVEKGKHIMWYAVLGLVLIGTAYVIIRLVGNIFGIN
ncbi:MAG: hypothetical protein HYR90_00250 [Candidatus Andersenbacteria bacterium]|nr:hypothetical protein [Candidatus Andersenbacteria bacterium]MBI3250670.1 hypothetical protein [Candidatus Andersenbacteria bacterium]